ncbi:MAG TPA: hypothetical protein VGD62_11685 [Acidobacteriaceae bacterium]
MPANHQPEGHPTQPAATFPSTWKATLLPARPLILPRRTYTYPAHADEVERGALELLITPRNADPFLATCALGFADPLAPSGIWPTPNPDQLCAAAGGYVYLIDTTQPTLFEQLPYRPVYSIHPAPAAGLLLFTGSRSILAYGAQGREWESPHLSDEGLTITSIHSTTLTGTAWHLATDRELPFTLNLSNGSIAVTN